MEQEIDDLFLSNKSTEYTDKSIDDLENNIKMFTNIIPYTNLIKDKISSIDTNFELYHIKLDKLANEMKDIEERNTKLENEIFYQTSIYENLKELLIKLQIKEEYFISLETEPFNEEGIIKIEEALDILENFSEDKFTIRVVVEKQNRIKEAINKFYSKFVCFITNLLKDEQDITDFQVHSDLYKKLEQYKFIFKMSKKHKIFYEKLCDLYTKNAKNRYEKELTEYLKRLLILNKESKKIENLKQTISTVLETYKFLIKVESTFLNTISIDLDTKFIFNNCNKKILDFFKDLYLILPIETICLLNENISNCELDDLELLLGKLKKQFLQKEVELREKQNEIDRFKNFINISKMDDFNNILFRINISRICRLEKDSSVFDIIESKRLLDELALSFKYNEEYKEAEKDLDNKLEKSVIDFVFEEGEVNKQIFILSKRIKGSSIFIKNVKLQIYRIVENNMDELQKEEAKKYLL